MAKAFIVYVTASTRKEADHIAQVVLNEKLAACVSIVPEIHSRYWWNGKLEYGQELLLIIKTTTSRYKALEKRVREIHSYSVPEVLALPVLEGNPAYLKWMKESVR